MADKKTMFTEEERDFIRRLAMSPELQREVLARIDLSLWEMEVPDENNGGRAL